MIGAECLLDVNPGSLELNYYKENETRCHAGMREILSYLHIPKCTSVCYLYETTMVIRIL